MRFSEESTRRRLENCWNKIEGRKRAGKESEVFLEGEKIPQERLHKRTYHNSYGMEMQPYLQHQGETPLTPPGFTITTPEAHDVELVSVSNVNLPFMEFEVVIGLNSKSSCPVCLLIKTKIFQ